MKSRMVLAGIAVVSTGMTLSQLKVVNRTLSQVTLDTEEIVETPIEQLERRLIWNGSIVAEKLRKPSAGPPSFKTHPEFSENLVDEFITGAKKEAASRRKRRKQKIQQKENNRKDTKNKTKKAKLKVPTPIFVPSLPKSGTTTTHQYFQCGGQSSAHLAARNGNDIFKIGRCAQRNVMAGRAPFSGCGDYDVWTDTGYVAARYQPDGKDLQQHNIQCYYPLINALEEVYTSYPNATILFVVRETEGWLKSIQNYHDGFIMDVWKRCRTLGFPGLDGTLEDFREFYEWHKEMIRNFALEHPSLTYIEVDLEASDAGDILQDRVGIDANCWGHYNQGKADTPKSDRNQRNEEDEENSEE